jgi:Conserved region in glutamate synthase
MRPNGVYRRYEIGTEPAPDAVRLPPRFRVRVSKRRLIGLILRELMHTRGDLPVALSRPCVYGVFARPAGGLAPIEERCVGCLRCTVQYPGVVQIHRNPEWDRLGDGLLAPEAVDTILYEARTGRVPVRGAGYRGPFGGPGWDGIWLDMSEIVRPTRDGIHGREVISTMVDIGEKPAYLRFDEAGEPVGPAPHIVSIQVPFVFDAPPTGARSGTVTEILLRAAREIETLAIVPADRLDGRCLGAGSRIVPLVGPDEVGRLARLAPPLLVGLDGWEPAAYAELGRLFPGSLRCVRVPADADVLDLARHGVRVVHLVAGPDGMAAGRFVAEVIRQAHERLVDAGLREQVTLLGSGGIAAAEHVPKAIACGLDAVALDTALWVALQARFHPEASQDGRVGVAFPHLEVTWGVRRIRNLAASWRDQLLEVLGAMGLREVRRLRGELGRLLFQRDLEREAFGGIEGHAE